MDFIKYSDREINQYHSLNIIKLTRKSTEGPLMLQQVTNILKMWLCSIFIDIIIIWRCDLFVRDKKKTFVRY